MTSHDERLARLLKRAHEAVEPRPDSPEARARTVAALEAAIAAPRLEKPAARWPLALAAGVSLALGGALWSQLRPRPVAEVLAATGGALRVGQGLADATLVESGEGAVSLSLPHAVKLHLAPASALQLRDEGARVLVRRGEVAAEITALEQPFVLEAGDTVVSTRGARLRVRPGAGCDGQAAVEVSEGSALVNATTTLRAGEHWPRCEAATAPRTQPPEPAPEAPAPVVTPPHTPPPHAAAPHTTPQPAPAGTAAPSKPAKEDDRLAKQNELYLQAVTLQRAGEVDLAVKKLDLILADLRSPLAEAALTQKMKWLSATDRPRAREAAREYLQRFPMGFGRAEAETLVLEKP